MAKLCYSSGRALVILLGLLLSFFCLCSMAAQKVYVGYLRFSAPPTFNLADPYFYFLLVIFHFLQLRKDFEWCLGNMVMF